MQDELLVVGGMTALLSLGSLAIMHKKKKKIHPAKSLMEHSGDCPFSSVREREPGTFAGFSLHLPPPSSNSQGLLG